MLSDFFYFIFLFFIDNYWWWCWIHVLSLELGFFTTCQQVLIEYIMNHSSFWKFQLKHFLTNVLWDPKESISFLVQLLGESVWVDVFSFQLHVSSFFSSYGFYLFLLNCFFMIFWANSINFFASSQLCCNLVRNSSSFGNSIYTIKLPFYGYYPKLSINSICPITMYFLLLYWNSAAIIHSVQLFCQ